MTLPKQHGHQPHLLVGVLLFLTIVRPLPQIGNPFVVARVLDAIWFVFVVGALLVTSARVRIQSTFPNPPLCLIALFMATVLSLGWGGLILNREVVLRDFFELYRAPYYLLVFLLAARLQWSNWHLRRYFYLPLILATLFSGVVAISQGFDGILGSMTRMVYSPKTGGDVSRLLEGLLSEGSVRLRNCGTFGNPNYFGVIMAIIIPILVSGYAAATSKCQRFVLTVTLMLAILLELTSGARTGIAILFIGLIGYATFSWSDRKVDKADLAIENSNNRKKNRFFKSAVVIALAAGVLMILMPKLNRYTKTAEFLLKGDFIGIASLNVKFRSGKVFMSEVIQESLLFGFGPSKAVSSYLGDTQFTKQLYRYGLFGIGVWLAFWGSSYAVLLRRHRTTHSRLHRAHSRALLSMIPSFLAACLIGDFYDAPQVGTVVILFLGIGCGSNRNVVATIRPKYPIPEHVYHVDPALSH